MFDTLYWDYLLTRASYIKLIRIQKNEQEGVWYDSNGNKLNEKLHNKFPMEYDVNHVGCKSAFGSYTELIRCFGVWELLKLLFRGYKIVQVSVPEENVIKYKDYYLFKV